MSDTSDARAIASTGRGFAVLAAGEMAARLASFGAIVYVSQTLGAARFGVITFALALLLYAQRLVGWEFEGLGIPEMAQDTSGTRRAINGLFVFRGIVALAMLLVVLVVRVWLPIADQRVLLLYAAGLLCVVCNARFVHLMRRRPAAAAAARIVAEVVSATTILLFVHTSDDYARVPLGFIAGELAGTTLMLVALRHWPLSGGIDWSFAVERARRAVPLVMVALLGLVVFNCDLIMLRLMWGPEMAGIYGAAYTVISLVLNLAVAYNATVLPNFTLLRGDPAGRQAFYGSATLLGLVALGPLVVGGVVLAPQLVHDLFGPSYSSASLPLAILLLAAAVLVLRIVPTCTLVSLERRREVLVLNVVGAVLNVAINLAVIPRFGMVGAACSTLATDVVRTAIAFFLLRSEGLSVGRLAAYVRPVAALAGLGLVAWLLRDQSIWLSVPVAGVSYGLLLLMFGIVRASRGGISLGSAIGGSQNA